MLMPELIQHGSIKQEKFTKNQEDSCQYFMSLNLEMDQNYPLICGFSKDFVRNYNLIIVY